MRENEISNKVIGLAIDVHLAQTLTCMKLGNYKLGLLMNFKVVRLKNGIKRVINGMVFCDLSVKPCASLW